MRAYRKLESRAVQGKTCLQVQIEFDNRTHIFFTNSTVLERQLDEYRDMIPFEAKIEKRRNYYTFV